MSDGDEGTTRGGHPIRATHEALDVSWEVRQTRRFARVYKKLHDRQAADVDTAIAVVAENPACGEQKKGDLAALWVYKFH